MECLGNVVPPKPCLAFSIEVSFLLPFPFSFILFVSLELHKWWIKMTEYAAFPFAEERWSWPGGVREGLCFWFWPWEYRFFAASISFGSRVREGDHRFYLQNGWLCLHQKYKNTLGDNTCQQSIYRKIVNRRNITKLNKYSVILSQLIYAAGLHFNLNFPYPLHHWIKRGEREKKKCLDEILATFFSFFIFLFRFISVWTCKALQSHIWTGTDW